MADEKVYVADPLASARDDVSVAPSTTMVKVPVGTTVLELEPEATVIVIRSLAPGAGVIVAAESVVFDTTGAVEDPGHADSRLKKSTEPKPEASS
jgi:hypothetical protein